MSHRNRHLKNREERGINSEESGSASGTARGPTRANIRTWIHEKAVSRLRQILWEGQGNRLLQETTANPSVKKFLDAVPQVLVAIKEIHALTIANNADLLKKRTAPPAPRELLLCKDSNGLIPLHKAAGLGNSDIVRVILERAIDSVRAKDDQGKLPLHYAAYAVGSSGVREENKEVTYHLLVEAGSDESQTDNQSIAKTLEAEGELEGRSVAVKESISSLLPPQISPPSSPPPRPSSPGVVHSVPSISTFEPTAELTERTQTPTLPTPPPPENTEEEHGNTFNQSNEIKETELNSNLILQTSNSDDAKELDTLLNNADEYPSLSENNKATEEMMPTVETGVKKAEFRGLGAGSARSDKSIELKVHDDEDLDRAAREGDIELLFSVIISGEGSRLIGLTSDNPKIQNFLYDVPFQMEMIREIHEAASNGLLDNIQARLDRRKYAIAKEPSIGATPLHSAILGATRTKQRKREGAEETIRYLGSRFPESINQTDRYGRSPLHYTTALPDEETRIRLYDVLRQLGADSTIEDNLGHTPAYYLANPKEFPHEDLLPYMEYINWDRNEDGEVFSSGEEDEQNKSNGSSRSSAEASSNSQDPMHPMDLPVLWTEEGEYLAKSLGEPLVMGLSEVSQQRPKDPIGFLANYLKTFSRNYETAGKISTDGIHMTNTEGRNENIWKPFSIELFPEIFRSQEERDEHGQTAIHKAAARSGSRGSLLHLIRETGANIALRDELYRTPRDVAARTGFQQNVREIDSWVVTLARVGPSHDNQNGMEIFEAEAAMNMLKTMLLEGYDHILDAISSYNEGDNQEISKKKNQLDVTKDSSYFPIISLIKSLPTFEERREWLHSAIRAGSFEHMQEILLATSDSFDESNSLGETPPASLPTSPSLSNSPVGDKLDQHMTDNHEWPMIDLHSNDKFSPILGPAALAIAKNRRSRCSMHIAVLCQQLDIAKFIAQHFPQTLHTGDNLERTPLHYAMGIESVDNFSVVLIEAGANRVVKDLKGKQPSYYFINKLAIQKLQDEETFGE